MYCTTVYYIHIMDNVLYYCILYSDNVHVHIHHIIDASAFILFEYINTVLLYIIFI